MHVTSNDLLLVTGATGLVGSHVAEQALQRGWRVRALVRQNAKVGFLRGLNVELVDGDLDQPESLQSACEGVTIVIHCAAKVGDWGRTDEYRRINVTGTRSLLGAALARRH